MRIYGHVLISYVLLFNWFGWSRDLSYVFLCHAKCVAGATYDFGIIRSNIVNYEQYHVYYLYFFNVIVIVLTYGAVLCYFSL